MIGPSGLSSSSSGGTPVRWGILSTARIGQRRVIPAIQASRTGTVVAIASRAGAKAQEAAREHDIPHAYASYEALLDDPGVEAVYNPLPNSLHAPWSIAAAQAKKHVLCEKPLALDAAEAQRMVDASANAGVLLQEAFMYRFHPQIERLGALISDGAVGRPWLVRTAFSFTVQSADDIRLDPALGGGGLMDVGCYCVSVTRLVLGEPAGVHAMAVTERGVDVRLAGMLRYGGDTAGLLDCGLRAPFRQSCEVIGLEGTVLVRRPFLPGEDPAVLVVRRGEEEERIDIPGTNQYTLMVDAFGDCLRNQTPPRYPPQGAVANMRVLDMLRTAASRPAG